MASSNNFLSLYGAIDYQGIKVDPNNPVLTDFQPQYLVWVLPESVTDYNGNVIPCFKLFYMNPKGLERVYVYLPVTADLADLDDFLTALDDLSTTNLFTKFEDLVAINDAPFTTANVDTLVNNNLVFRRTYNVGTNTTDVYFTIVNDLLYDKITVTGDQTTAGSYDYFQPE